MVLMVFGYHIFGKKRLGIKVGEHLELVQSYEVQFAFIPIWFQRRIMLYDFLNKKYYELDNKLENKLLNLGKKVTLENLSKIIKDYEKEQHKKNIYYEIYKEEIEKKENEEFIQFLKWISVALGILIFLFVINKFLF